MCACTTNQQKHCDYVMHALSIGNCRNVRGLGNSKVAFRLSEKLRHSNERSANLVVFTASISIKRRKMAKWQLLKYYVKQRVCMDWVEKPQNYKDLYGILQTLRGCHLKRSLQRTLKLGQIAFHALKFQLRCLNSQSNQCKKLVPVLSRFCNWL